MPLRLLECERADEMRGAIWARADCRAPFPDISVVKGDFVEEVMSGSREPCLRDQRAGFEHRAVIGKTVDDIFNEFLRQLHL